MTRNSNTKKPCAASLLLLWRAGFAGVLATLVCTGITARAALVTVPPGLNPGDSYYLAFVTADTISGTSTAIADYNAFVQSQANAAGLGIIAGSPVTWKAAVSTPTTSAVANLGLGNAPIYRLDGVQIATGDSDLWDGSLMNPLNVDQYESTYGLGVAAWTGSNANGTPYNPYELGGTANLPVIGALDSTTVTWLVVNAVGSTNFNRVYAFSSELIVVPEPSQMVLVAGAGVILGACRMRKLRRGRPPAGEAVACW